MTDGQLREFEMTTLRRVGEKVMPPLVRTGLIPHTYMLTTVGRKSGTPRSHPVTLVERDGRRWLVAPYGPVGWVHNARAAGTVRIRRRGENSELRIREVTDPAEAAPILKDYLAITGPPRDYFTAAPEAPLAEFEAEAGRHPVFELLPGGR
ncbi:nitroreductase family deazaflavin-dependent oxidoreductase [Gordonia sp. PP30]|uniref:nitroreductase family deazaflavin-dependent oxidoreductase n=1 Tax=Gordonia sp. PP30 TaxID=2935861 RepID=UPI001FFFF79F|nr:nitroreductase family deazaflavin-dependent oxidoreductase [Gordonia sp. PP30]UQE73481.1 nitroreductase family deazaflavin-dependent oxidoreductase [Gordonia sp. PP30]